MEARHAEEEGGSVLTHGILSSKKWVYFIFTVVPCRVPYYCLGLSGAEMSVFVYCFYICFSEQGLLVLG